MPPFRRPRSSSISSLDLSTTSPSAQSTPMPIPKSRLRATCRVRQRVENSLDPILNLIINPSSSNEPLSSSSSSSSESSSSSPPISSNWVSMPSPPSSLGSSPLTRSPSLQCEVCGKTYTHKACINKHRWEHHDKWHEAATMFGNISKHQQVQMMEAAEILLHMSIQD